jgi:uncharacterized protein HemY
MAPGAVSDARIPVQWAERALAARPGDGGILTTLGQALYRDGSFAEAIRRLNEAIVARDKKGDPSHWYFLAMAHACLGHREEARRYYDQADRWLTEALNRKEGDSAERPLRWDQRLLFRHFRDEATAVLKQIPRRMK